MSSTTIQWIAVVDTYATHRHPKVRKCNAVEGFFAKLTNRRLKHADGPSDFDPVRDYTREMERLKDAPPRCGEPIFASPDLRCWWLKFCSLRWYQYRKRRKEGPGGVVEAGTEPSQAASTTLSTMTPVVIAPLFPGKKRKGPSNIECLDDILGAATLAQRSCSEVCRGQDSETLAVVGPFSINTISQGLRKEERKNLSDSRDTSQKSRRTGIDKRRPFSERLEPVKPQ